MPSSRSLPPSRSGGSSPTTYTPSARPAASSSAAAERPPSSSSGRIAGRTEDGSTQLSSTARCWQQRGRGDRRGRQDGVDDPVHLPVEHLLDQQRLDVGVPLRLADQHQVVEQPRGRARPGQHPARELAAGHAVGDDADRLGRGRAQAPRTAVGAVPEVRRGAADPSLRVRGDPHLGRAAVEDVRRGGRRDAGPSATSMRVTLRVVTTATSPFHSARGSAPPLRRPRSATVATSLLDTHRGRAMILLIRFSMWRAPQYTTSHAHGVHSGYPAVKHEENHRTHSRGRRAAVAVAAVASMSMSLPACGGDDGDSAGDGTGHHLDQHGPAGRRRPGEGPGREGRGGRTHRQVVEGRRHQPADHDQDPGQRHPRHRLHPAAGCRRRHRGARRGASRSTTCSTWPRSRRRA